MTAKGRLTQVITQDKKTFDKTRKKILLLGIFIDQQGRFLLVKTPNGYINFPGGKIKKYHREEEKNQKNLRKMFFQKTGMLVEINYTIGYRSKDKNLPKLLKLYAVSIKKQFKKPFWKKNPNYHIIWLTPEQATTNDRVTPAVKTIMTDLASGSNIQSIKALE